MTTPAYEEFEAATLFCPRCRAAVPVRKKLLLVLLTGTKYDYVCARCGSQIGGKVEQEGTDFPRIIRPSG
ncbi:MAG: cytoplasmic protein [Candidatus Methylomirabilia bacterium]